MDGFVLVLDVVVLSYGPELLLEHEIACLVSDHSTDGSRCIEVTLDLVNLVLLSLAATHG